MKLPFSHLSNAEWERLLDVGLIFGVLLWLVILAYSAINQHWGNDFRHFWIGARTLVDGGEPYRQLYHYPGAEGPMQEKFNPLPWVAVAFIPLGLVPFEQANTFWIILNFIFLGVILLIGYDLGKGNLPLWGLALLGFWVVWISARCIQSGQLGLLITLLALLGVREFQKGQSVRGGLLFSATLLKPWIIAGALLAALFVAASKGRYRFLWGLISGTVAIILFTTFLWPTWFLNYLRVDFSTTLFMRSLGGGLVDYWPVATLFDFFHFILGWSLSAPGLLLAWLLLLMAILSLGLEAANLWRKQKISDMALIGISTLLGLLVIPYVRFYDYAVLTLWLFGIFLVDGRRYRRFPVSYAIIAAPVLGVFMNLGEHLEPWVYQIPVWLYLASWLFALERARYMV
jgi:hypothetical protein